MILKFLFKHNLNTYNSCAYDLGLSLLHKRFLFLDFFNFPLGDATGESKCTVLIDKYTHFLPEIAN